MKTGRLIQGSVQDCDKKAFLRELQGLDPQLYIKWNAAKKDGMGCWEIRRRPDTKTAVPRWEYEGKIIFDLQYAEIDMVSHVMDLPCLHYGAITYLKSIDTWTNKSWVSDFEYREEDMLERERAKNREELKYKIKFHKKAFSDFQEFVLSGRNPADFLGGDW